MNERDIFIAALEIEDHDSVQAFLTEACGDDQQLLSRVQELLASHAVGDSFLNMPAVAQIEAEQDLASWTILTLVVLQSGETEIQIPISDVNDRLFFRATAQ
jgi:hypothetical protein